MFELLNWNEAKLQRSRRQTKCKNCDSMFGPKAINWEKGDIIKAGEPRLVFYGTGFGRNTRHVSLCVECAKSEADKLESMAVTIRKEILYYGFS